MNAGSPSYVPSDTEASRSTLVLELRQAAGRADGRRRSWPRRPLNQSEISTSESGQANPTYRTLQTLAAALGGKIELVIGCPGESRAIEVTSFQWPRWRRRIRWDVRRRRSLALEHGASAHVVASSLGHESFSTTVESYAKPEAIAGARQRRVLTVLDGGGLASSP